MWMCGGSDGLFSAALLVVGDTAVPHAVHSKSGVVTFLGDLYGGGGAACGV